MPSPFPGMDPYLEAPSLWPSVHARLINTISDMLTRQVAPRFVVTIEERVTIAEPSDPPFRDQPATVEAAHVTAPTIVEALYPAEIVERYIEICDAQGNEIITTIEVLSPRNKAPNSKGRDSFMNKRRSMMASQTHWVEIDLLRRGERPAEVTGHSDYYVLLHRGQSLKFAVWFFDLRDALPTITVPLLAPADDATLDLGAAIADVYSRGAYAARIDYNQPPPSPPLRPADTAWAAAQVAEQK